MYYAWWIDYTYLNHNHSYKIHNLYTNSNIWEGLFIDINESNLCRALTFGNIYRPPRDDNNNANIQQFVSELSPIIKLLQSENTYSSTVGDFHTNLLKYSEHDTFVEFFDLMCLNNFFPTITFSTRFTNHFCSLIDQIFCQTPHKKTRVYFVLHISK